MSACSSRCGRGISLQGFTAVLCICLPVAAGGVVFRFTASRVVPLTIQQVGHAMGVGDLDGDGRDELVVGVRPVGIIAMRQQDGITFGLPYWASRGVAPTWLRLTDITGDGNLDILAGYAAGPPVLRIYPGDGRGGFSDPLEQQLQGVATSFAVADFNLDGAMDVAALYQRAGRHFVSVFWNKGGGIFEPGQEFEGHSLAIGDVTAGDFDGDAWPDLAVSHSLDRRGQPWPTVSIYWNSSGVLDTANPMIVSTRFAGNPLPFDEGFPIGFPWGHADLNGDGIDDLVIANTCPLAQPSSQSLFAGPQSRASQASTERGAGRGSVASAELPGALTATETSDWPTWGCGYLTVIAGAPSRQFSSTRHIPIGWWPRAPHVADLDGDSIPDIAVGGEFALSVLFGDGNFGFEPHHFPLVSHWPNTQVATTDLNGDGLLDLLHGASTYVHVIPAIGPRRYTPLLGLRYRGASGPAGFSLCDVDGDGVSDVVATDGVGTAWTYLNRPEARDFVGPVISRLASPEWQLNVHLLLGVDANRDGLCDLLVQPLVLLASEPIPSAYSAGPLGIYFGDGSGSFSGRSPVYGDFPAPHNPPLRTTPPWKMRTVQLKQETVVLGLGGGLGLGIYRFGADGSPQVGQVMQKPSGPEGGRVEFIDGLLWDFDEDGDEDVIAGFRSVRLAQPFGTPVEHIGVAAYPRNGDSFAITPIVSTNMWRESEQLRFRGIGDVDGDHVLDLLWSVAVASPDGNYHHLAWTKGNKRFEFADPQIITPPFGGGIGGQFHFSPSLFVSVRDVNGDGMNDIVGSGYGLTIFENQEVASFGPPVTYSLTYRDADRHSFELMDLDLDGRLDAITFSGDPGKETGVRIIDELETQMQTEWGVFVLYNSIEPPPLFTATPTSTPGVTPTFTLLYADRTLRAWTVTPTPPPSASPSPPPTQTSRCPGDCNGDGRVTIDELVAMVNIALETKAVSECSTGDTNSDGRLTIDEIVQAVNRALHGC